MQVRQIKIDFFVTPTIKRYVLADCITSYDLGKIDEMLEYYANKGCIVEKLVDVTK